MSDEPKPKKVNVALIDRKENKRPYEILDELVNANHEHLIGADIALAWRFGWKADADGILRLGQCRKASDLDRELHGHDFVILLNHEAWNAAQFGESQMRALLDHELCHAQVQLDDDGEVKLDEHGNTVYRIRHHDIEEFKEIVSRHGLWISSLEDFAKAAIEKADPKLFGEEAAIVGRVGGDAVTRARHVVNEMRDPEVQAVVRAGMSAVEASKA